MAVGLAVPRLLAGDDGTIRLSQRGGDVWARTVVVAGAADGCDEAEIRAGARVVTATVEAGRFSAKVPLAPGENRVTAECAGGRAERTYVSRGRVEAPTAERVEGRPSWVDEAVIYGVVPRSFGETGGFADVTARLDDLAELGVTALWLSPSNRTPEGDFGYAVTDYFALREDYGTEDEFRTLIDGAHRRGIRVLMDFVPNHTSAAHPYFVDAERDGRASRYWDFYDRDADGQATHYFDWAHLPNLNFENPEVDRMVLDAFAHWVREFDVDGFRVDVAWGIKERKPDFWPRWRAELKALKPDVFLLAEASARDPYYLENGFDAAYDWTEELGHWAWEGVFDAPTPAELVERLDAALAGAGSGAHVFRFLNNNDTGASFVARHGTDTTRVAAALLLTLPGIPCVYTGEEVGAFFSPYVDTGPIAWRDRFDLRGWYRTLIALRKTLPALHGPGFERLPTPGAPGVYAYVRRAPDERPVLVVLNFAGEPASARLELPDGLTGRLRDELTGAAVAPGPIAVEAYGALILTREESE